MMRSPDTCTESVRVCTREGMQDLRIPSHAYSFDGFRTWVSNPSFPEKTYVTFLSGIIYAGLAGEGNGDHLAVRGAVSAAIFDLEAKGDLGEFFCRGAFYSNREAQLACYPDAMGFLWSTFDSGTVSLVGEIEGDEDELQGSPDWILEIVSDQSVDFDTSKLQAAYHRAHIAEYWIIDARGQEVEFQIFQWRADGYACSGKVDGWLVSSVFRHRFQLIRKRDRLGGWNYTLLFQKL